MNYLITVGKISGDSMFQLTLYEPSLIEIQNFCEDFCKNLSDYYRYREKEFLSKDKEFFLEDINEFFKNPKAYEKPYVYWVTNDVFLTIAILGVNTYEDWKSKTNPFANMSFINAEPSNDDEDIGKINFNPYKQVKPSKLILTDKDKERLKNVFAKK